MLKDFLNDDRRGSSLYRVKVHELTKRIHCDKDVFDS